MHQVLFIAADLEKRAEALRVAECVFPGKTVRYSDLTSSLLLDVSLVVVDIAGADGPDLKVFKALFDLHPQIIRIGLADVSIRKDLVQAKAIGISEVIDRRSGPEALVSSIRVHFGTYGTPDLPASTAAATATAIMSGCSVMEEASVAAVLNKALPVSAAVSVQRKISAALEADGLESLLEAVQSHHSHTFCHSMLVTVHALAFAEVLGLSSEEKAYIGAGALIHDLGKVRIPLSVLDKPGKLDESEMELVKKIRFSAGNCWQSAPRCRLKSLSSWYRTMSILMAAATLRASPPIRSAGTSD